MPKYSGTGISLALQFDCFPVANFVRHSSPVVKSELYDIISENRTLNGQDRMSKGNGVYKMEKTEGSPLVSVS